MRDASRQSRIDIVVPVRDGARDLPGLLEALARLRGLEPATRRIVVDNGSTDETARVLAGHPELTVLQATDWPSSYLARNRGWKDSDAEIIAFTDADCRPEPGWLEGLRTPFSDPRVAGVCGPIVPSEPDNPWEQLSEWAGLLDQSSFHARRPWAAAATANLAVRRSSLEKLGGFDESRTTGADFDLCWRLQKELGQKLVFAHRAIVAHRFRRSLHGVFGQGFRNGRAAAWLGGRFPESSGVSRRSSTRLLKHLEAWGSFLSFPIHPRRAALLAPWFLLARDAGLVLGRLSAPRGSA